MPHEEEVKPVDPYRVYHKLYSSSEVTAQWPVFAKEIAGGNESTHYSGSQEGHADQQVGEGEPGAHAARHLRRGCDEDVQCDDGQEHGHTQHGQRPCQPGGDAAAHSTYSWPLFAYASGHDFTTLQHHRLPRVTRHHFMLTIVPAKFPCSDLCRSFSNMGTVTKPGALARRLM